MGGGGEGVGLNIWTKIADVHGCEVLLLHFSVQKVFYFRNENVLHRKMGYFRKSCLTNWDKVLNFVTLKLGVPMFNRASNRFMWKFFSTFTDCGE